MDIHNQNHKPEAIENFLDHFKELEAEIQTSLQTKKIACSKEQYLHILKKLTKKLDQNTFSKFSIKFLDTVSEENCKRPILLKEYLINQMNQAFQMAFVQVLIN